MRRIIATIVLLLSLSLIVFSFNVVFLEEAPEHKYPAISEVEHILVDATEPFIQLKTQNIRVLHKFAEDRYLSEWHSKFLLIVFSLVSGVLAILVLISGKSSNE